MIALGIIAIIAGVISLIWGIVQNNSLEMQLTSLLSNGSTNPGTTWIVVGVILLILGIVFLVLGKKRKSTN